MEIEMSNNLTLPLNNKSSYSEKPIEIFVESLDDIVNEIKKISENIIKDNASP